MRVAYPKPSPTGGRLIREVIAFLKQNGISLPLKSSLLIAVSGGSDSVALAHLLIHYGRKIGVPSQVRLLHVNHGWRGKDSDDDAVFVKNLAKRWGVPFSTFRLKDAQKAARGESWEDVARKARKKIFRQQAEKWRGIVFTAHHADDLAETVLWRLFTGAAQTHGGGIVVRHGVELRPFLRVRKKVLQHYLKEEGQSWREDITNQEARFLRARMRKELMAPIEHLFPRAVDRLVELALQAQKRGEPWKSAPELLFSSTGITKKRLNLTGEVGT